MTQEEKDLVVKDLCAKLPYGVKAHIEHDTFYDEIEPYDGTVDTNTINDLLRNEKLEVRPYLRPMSSMTEEEKTKIASMSNFNNITKSAEFVKCSYPIIDYCCSRHLDFRGLISKGLALEAPGGMYK